MRRKQTPADGLARQARFGTARAEGAPAWRQAEWFEIGQRACIKSLRGVTRKFCCLNNPDAA